MVHGMCKHCGHLQRTKAKRWWNCEKCHRRNYIPKQTFLKPPKKREYIEKAVTDFGDKSYQESS